MIYVGIDSGKSGGIAFVSKEDGHCVMPLPDAYELNQLIKNWQADFGIIHCFLERAHAFPGQGTVSMFSYGEQYGRIQGILISNEIPYTLVQPREWQMEMFKGTKDKQAGEKRNPKDRALEIVRRLFPKERFIATLRSKKPHDGMIDSILIAECCRRKII